MDMANGYTDRPMPDKCHLMHLNHKKYAFEANARKGADVLRGDKHELNPVATLFATR